ncbi:MAG TPA: glycerophosphodiester phosphodiesterase family protein [Tepidisphaeraceae bacterium]|jgi:glycerophosphoryl diester phosphodiesterase|nr:glycerophosphodiester phosphodiesterase family protein [Tepidisphaeraceae bacterium]
MPEHTLEGYRLALDLGADALETDVVLTGDGELVCRHDCELSDTTDVASRAEFAGRKTVKCIDGETAEGWFIDDFTLAEVQTLRARQRFAFRDRSFDGQFAIPTLGELIDLVASDDAKTGRRPGLVVEIKHAAYFDTVGKSMADTIGDTLGRYRDTPPPIWIECFEVDVLRRLRRKISAPIIQLVDAPNMRPADVAAAGGSLTFGDMIAPGGLGQIAGYASGIGAWKELILPRAPVAGTVGRQKYAGCTSLIADAHRIGLSVHAWTFRSESYFLTVEDEDDPSKEYRRFAALDLDGFITDDPDAAAKALLR